MVLSARAIPAVTDRPWLVWLHGFLGSQHDWSEIQSLFGDWSCLWLDLPGHGGSFGYSVSDFSQVSQAVANTLTAYDVQEYILIGYSLGGRLAAYYSCYQQAPGLRGVILEGSNLGLTDKAERQQRLANDLHWAMRFRTQPLEMVLSDWYQQTVFAELTLSERQKMIKERQLNQGDRVASMLEATSLGHQPWLLPLLQQKIADQRLLCGYLCGEHDIKFQQLAAQYQLPFKTVAAAGHNAHRANPREFAHQLTSFLKETN